MLVTMKVVFLAPLIKGSPISDMQDSGSNHIISYKRGKQLAPLVLVGLQAVFGQGWALWPKGSGLGEGD